MHQHSGVGVAVFFLEIDNGQTGMTNIKMACILRVRNIQQAAEKRNAEALMSKESNSFLIGIDYLVSSAVGNMFIAKRGKEFIGRFADTVNPVLEVPLGKFGMLILFVAERTHFRLCKQLF